MKKTQIFFTFFSVLFGASCLEGTTTNYKVFPIRRNDEAAVVEWGNSAIISALDAAVAKFGPQTSHEAFFEVETQPVLAEPLNGRGDKMNIAEEEDRRGIPYPGPLDNKDAVEGNMVVMTNEGSNMSAVAMARVAKESGAAALMIVNFDRHNPDSIYSLKSENDSESVYAEENIDIPIIMVSLASGNLITTATVEEGMDEEDIVNDGMPDRVRLYGAGDRPFFEDAISQSPVLYLIHNLLNDEECETLLQLSEGKFEKVDDTRNSLLENIVAQKDRGSRAHLVEKFIVWRGQLKGRIGKEVDERIEQVTGYPQDQFSDWHITKFGQGSKHDLHYDFHPIHSPVATITVFLNNLEGGGGEIVFPKAGNDEHPIMVKPKKGLAVVHHNTDFDGHFDLYSLYGEKPVLKKGEEKYVARKFVYSEPLPPSKKIFLPLVAGVNGGKLPGWITFLHDYVVTEFGLETGSVYFDKLCIILPICLLLAIVSAVYTLLQRSNSRTDNTDKKIKHQ